MGCNNDRDGARRWRLAADVETRRSDKGDLVAAAETIKALSSSSALSKNYGISSSDTAFYSKAPRPPTMAISGDLNLVFGSLHSPPNHRPFLPTILSSKISRFGCIRFVLSGSSVTLSRIELLRSAARSSLLLLRF
ncbi:hypothetical protein ZIOFF_028224 [Zingiber officinale]|uniref:Uncharacterized protein n=1 Tax=Zingiber officinale TaxID=94328 RepID=A0A8J5GMK1_ZINOF|nr:hypothetical protein ZIOFF_028224 [Zingiber officinale]